MSSETIPVLPKHIHDEEALTPACKELISTLPREKGLPWPASYLYLYRGCWYFPRHLQGVISCQKHFQANDSDIFLATYPKSGTTWLKSIMFTLLNRKRYPVGNQHHLLVIHNPHELVSCLEIDVYANNRMLDIASSTSSPRLLATHLSYVSLPESVKYSTTCKMVYLCRNPKDTLVSLWHFTNKFRPQDMGVEILLQRFQKSLVTECARSGRIEIMSWNIGRRARKTLAGFCS